VKAPLHDRPCTDRKIQQIIRLQPELRVGLHINLKYLTEFIELIDVG
jgi:hypothetical protein